MKKLTNQEINYLLSVLEDRKGGIKTRDPEIEVARLDKTEIYFLQQKLENLKN